MLLARHRLTVEHYHRMAEAGILPPGQRTELIDGEIIDMAPIGTRHAALVRKLGRVLELQAGNAYTVSVQNPLRLSDQSEPEPDLVLLTYRADSYEHAHPTPADVKLLIEVADTTLRYDTQIKLPLYARHGVSEVWVFDLEAHRLHRWRQPQGDAYTLLDSLDHGSAMTLAAAPGLTLDLSSLAL
ncbi:MAG: Uma2 family endonuclease [Rubrivivax sp.]|nr:Uma2 family endonuclease [Rubrivivax sp.]